MEFKYFLKTDIGSKYYRKFECYCSYPLFYYVSFWTSYTEATIRGPYLLLILKDKIVHGEPTCRKALNITIHEHPHAYHHNKSTWKSK